MALLDLRVQTEARQRGMELGLRATGDAVGRPGIDVVRRGREMSTGFDVPVLSGDDQAVILPVRSRLGGHALGDRIPAGDGEGPAFTEGRLDIDDDQGATGSFRMISSSLCHATYSTYSTITPPALLEAARSAHPKESGGIQRAIWL